MVLSLGLLLTAFCGIAVIERDEVITILNLSAVF